MGIGSVSVIQQNVQLTRNGVQSQLNRYQTVLFEGDRISTEIHGKACIIFSLISGNNEICLAPNSEILFRKQKGFSNIEILHVILEYGSAWAQFESSQTNKVILHLGSSEIFSDNCEFFIVKKNEDVKIGTISGLTKLSTSTKKVIDIPERMAVSFSEFETFSDLEYLDEITFSRDYFDFNKKTEKDHFGTKFIKPHPLINPKYYKKIQPVKNKPDIVQDQSPVSDIDIVKNDSTMETKDNLPVEIIDNNTEETVGDDGVEIAQVESESFLVKYFWHITSSSTFIISSWLAYDRSNQYSNISSENSSILKQYEVSTYAETRAQLNSDYESNLNKLKTIKTEFYFFSLISAIALGFEVYHIYNDFYKEETTIDIANKNKNFHFMYSMIPNHQKTFSSGTLSFTWKF